jgi:hypothetical protein
MRTLVLGLTLTAWLLASAGTLGCSRRSVEVPDPASIKAYDPVRDKPETVSPGGGKAARGRK